MALDNINKLIAMPYEKYFGEMGITEEQKKKRIELAKQLEELFIILFVLMRREEDLANFDIETTEDRMFRALRKTGMNITDRIESIVHERIEHIVDVTKRHIDEEWYTSKDRAKVNAEEESNTFWNSMEYEDALKAGYKWKTWETMKDFRVRKTHTPKQGKTIGIREYFKFDECEMLYPRDPNGTPDEIDNCRCWLIYTK